MRGALYDLKPHEPPPGGYGNRLDYLSAEEQRAEMLCEEERYLFLYHNEEEHILQQGKLSSSQTLCLKHNFMHFCFGFYIK